MPYQCCREHPRWSDVLGCVRVPVCVAGKKVLNKTSAFWFLVRVAARFLPGCLVIYTARTFPLFFATLRTIARIIIFSSSTRTPTRINRNIKQKFFNLLCHSYVFCYRYVCPIFFVFLLKLIFVLP